MKVQDETLSRYNTENVIDTQRISKYIFALNLSIKIHSSMKILHVNITYLPKATRNCFSIFGKERKIDTK